MVTQIFIITIIGVLAFIPILIWGYIFSYINNSILNSKRFLIGIIAGALSVVPILYLENILNYFSLNLFNIFNLISEKNLNYLIIFISILLITIFIAIFLLISGLLFLKDFKKTFQIYIKNLTIISLFSLIFIIIYLLFNKLSFLGLIIDSPIIVSNNIFNTLGLIILYYIIIGFIEETSKHLSFLQSSIGELNSIKQGIILVIFVTLGFGFLENILYLYTIYNQNGFSSNFTFTLIFRGIFSVFVHIICGVIVGFYFLEGFLKKIKIFNYIKIFLYGLLFSIGIHCIFDVFLTLNFNIIIFIYAILGYFYLTKLFYKEKN